jgi:release factor glutamine methyltransferase
MKQAKKYFREKLSGLYDLPEINSFFFLIINHLLGLSKSEMIIDSGLSLSTSDFIKLAEITLRLSCFEPIQYILGKTEFYGLPFLVEPGVLIPRFETEELVDLIIKKNSENRHLKIIDIGCGSGCIAISLKKNLPFADVWCCDISDKAIEVTNKNAVINQVKINIEKFDILSGHVFKEKGFNLIVSNPPYVTLKEKEVMPQNVLDYEPSLALFVPENDPLVFYKAIILNSHEWLLPDGDICFEINELFGHEILELLVHAGFDAEICKDINGKDRIAIGRRRK